MGITDKDFLGSIKGESLYQGDRVYWTHHNGQGDDPRRSGALLAVMGDEAWVDEGIMKHTVSLSSLSLTRPDEWGPQ